MQDSLRKEIAILSKKRDDLSNQISELTEERDQVVLQRRQKRSELARNIMGIPETGYQFDITGPRQLTIWLDFSTRINVEKKLNGLVISEVMSFSRWTDFVKSDFSDKLAEHFNTLLEQLK
jgi:hypothetical protein